MQIINFIRLCLEKFQNQNNRKSELREIEVIFCIREKFVMKKAYATFIYEIVLYKSVVKKECFGEATLSYSTG